MPTIDNQSTNKSASTHANSLKNPLLNLGRYATFTVQIYKKSYN